MTRRASQPHSRPGLAAALAIVRLVMQFVEAIFADMGDLPERHPDRRCYDRLCRELRRAEARILADMAGLEAEREARDCAEARAAAVRRGLGRRPLRSCGGRRLPT